MLDVSPHDFPKGKRIFSPLHPEEKTTFKGVLQTAVDSPPVAIVRQVSFKHGGWALQLDSRRAFLKMKVNRVGTFEG